MTETRLDEPFDVRLKTNVTPGLLSLKIRPSESADVNSRVTLSSEDEGSKSILHPKRVKEPSFGTSHRNVSGCPTQIFTATPFIDAADNMQADGIQISCMTLKLASICTILFVYLPESANNIKQRILNFAVVMPFSLIEIVISI